MAREINKETVLVAMALELYYARMGAVAASDELSEAENYRAKNVITMKLKRCHGREEAISLLARRLGLSTSELNKMAGDSSELVVRAARLGLHS